LTVALPESLNEATNPQALYANPSPLIMAAIVYLAFFWPMVASSACSNGNSRRRNRDDPSPRRAITRIVRG
jgi:hypothetical protein